MWQKMILKPFWRLKQKIRCHVNVKKKSGFSELLSLSLVCRRRTVDSTTLKEGGERHGPGMWSDSAWPPHSSALPLSPLGSQGATPPHYNGVYRLQWPPPTLHPLPRQCKPLGGTAHHSTARFSIINTRVMGATQRKHCSPGLSGRTRERAVGLVSLPEMHQCATVCGLECLFVCLFVFRKAKKVVVSIDFIKASLHSKFLLETARPWFVF